MSEDINLTEGTITEVLNNKVDLDGGNYKGSELEAYIHEHCSGGQPIGTVYPLVCSPDYIPDGSLPTDGTEYSKGQFENFWNDFLSGEISYVTNKKLICPETAIIDNGILSNVQDVYYDENVTTGKEIVLKFINNDTSSTQRLFSLEGTGYISIIDNMLGITYPDDTELRPNHFVITLTQSDFYIKIQGDETPTGDWYRWNIYLSYDGLSYDFLIDWSVGSDEITEFLKLKLYQCSGQIDLKNSYFKNANKTSYFALQKIKSILNTCSYAEYENELNTYGFSNKFAIDLDNETFKVPKAKQIDRYLIKKKKATESDPTWYNLYSDGYCEQGGFEPASTAVLKTIIFLIPFKEKPSLTGGIVSSGSASGATSLAIAYETTTLTNNQFVMQISASVAKYWQVTGYADISAYELPRQFVVVANGQINQSMMDWSAWASSLQGKVNVDGSNFNESVKNIDGQWVQSFYTITSTGGTLSGVQYDLSEYLPKDDYAYDVKFNLGAYDDDSSYYYYIQTDIFNSGHTDIDNSAYKQLHGGVHSRQNRIVLDLPVGVGRFIKLYGSGADTVELNALGYRRIGKNV